MKHILYLILTVTFFACNRASSYNFPVDVDTRTKDIRVQKKQTWSFPETGLTVDNEFDGARLNELRRDDDTSYTVTINPENEPINQSPWYAMRFVSDRDQTITVRLTYPPGVHHRYFPKVSTDRKVWAPADSTSVKPGPGQFSADVRLTLAEGEPLYLAGQEVINSADVKEWLETLSRKHGDVMAGFYVGESKLGRNLEAYRIGEGEMDDRPTIVLLSRQHPPEVTGFLCLQAFLDGVLEHPRRDEFFTKYQLLVYPLLNPDGVDLGHWRHTAGGIDSNRDWAKYRQPEVRKVANNIVKLTKESRSDVVLGIDFHSTYKDVYYTHNDKVQPPTALPGFKDAWLAAIARGIGGGFRINEEAEPIGKPTSMSWFRTQFGAEGITYEIGDGTDRAFVRKKGIVSADALINVLLAR
ncbi:hypothetical protein FUA23_17000 [Neolewinella aurantiaca]|uniref:Peptidase M14 domain-containing protein n=1 Tax=Neolewinella aurantiaca TaxID=2602767 RepID=A0A5C7FPK7_9BACT|nr:M14 family metallopeptidase [Neolewinella aurantiaca]TXF87857.1 hypothetical protein FUA23_17000 [Neolewinella aurantiaca]